MGPPAAVTVALGAAKVKVEAVLIALLLTPAAEVLDAREVLAPEAAAEEAEVLRHEVSLDGCTVKIAA